MLKTPEHDTSVFLPPMAGGKSASLVGSGMKGIKVPVSLKMINKRFLVLLKDKNVFAP